MCMETQKPGCTGGNEISVTFGNHNTPFIKRTKHPFKKGFNVLFFFYSHFVSSSFVHFYLSCFSTTNLKNFPLTRIWLFVVKIFEYFGTLCSRRITGSPKIKWDFLCRGEFGFATKFLMHQTIPRVSIVFSQPPLNISMGEYIWRVENYEVPQKVRKNVTLIWKNEDSWIHFI